MEECEGVREKSEKEDLKQRVGVCVCASMQRLGRQRRQWR